MGSKIFIVSKCSTFHLNPFSFSNFFLMISFQVEKNLLISSPKLLIASLYLFIELTWEACKYFLSSPHILLSELLSPLRSHFIKLKEPCLAGCTLPKNLHTLFALLLAWFNFSWIWMIQMRANISTTDKILKLCYLLYVLHLGTGVLNRALRVIQIPQGWQGGSEDLHRHVGSVNNSERRILLKAECLSLSLWAAW